MNALRPAPAEVDLLTAIAELKEGLEAMGFSTGISRLQVMRLEVLKGLRQKGSGRQSGVDGP